MRLGDIWEAPIVSVFSMQRSHDVIGSYSLSETVVYYCGYRVRTLLLDGAPPDVVSPLGI